MVLDASIVLKPGNKGVFEIERSGNESMYG